MNLNEFAKEIHENAKAHGWWDEPRPFDELCALMISELSEALEEARAGRPMEWHWGEMTATKGLGDPIGGVHIYMKEGHQEGCKPEGIAVEMADCAIRILDYLGHEEVEIKLYPVHEYKDLCSAFVDAAHHISRATIWKECDKTARHMDIIHALAVVIGWFEANDLDFEAIARRKHEYNKSRPYKHGKEF